MLVTEPARRRAGALAPQLRPRLLTSPSTPVPAIPGRLHAARTLFELSFDRSGHTSMPIADAEWFALSWNSRHGKPDQDGAGHDWRSLSPARSVTDIAS